jgi:chromate transporter
MVEAEIRLILLGPHGLAAADWLGLFGHFLMLSLLAVGGALGTAPEMHRYAVGQQHWLTDGQFTASVALAQSAPGPNLLFVAVLGYNIAGLAGVAVTMAGMLIPSSTLALVATRWGARRRESRGVRAFVAGLAPLTLGLLLSTGWILSEPFRTQPGALALTLGATLVAWRSRLSPVWIVGAGALLGAVGWV